LYTWSKWHESLRKKVECFFGRLKRRYRILASKVSFEDLVVVDKMFKVCCCMDVMIREYDEDFALKELSHRATSFATHSFITSSGSSRIGARKDEVRIPPKGSTKTMFSLRRFVLAKNLTILLYWVFARLNLLVNLPVICKFEP
jgi:hypothetical protein